MAELILSHQQTRFLVHFLVLSVGSAPRGASHEGSGAQGAEICKQLQVEAPHRAPNLIANCLKLNIPFLFPFNSYLMRSTTLKMRRNCNGNAKNNSYRHNFAREKHWGLCCLRDWLFFSAKNWWVVLVDGLGYGRNRQCLQTRGNWIREVWNQWARNHR